MVVRSSVPLSGLRVLALDIGGANLKLADGRGYAASWPFDLWKQPEKLAIQLRECLAAAPPADHLIVTMTGELCDCFATKSEGVAAIVSAAVEASGNLPARFYQTTGALVSAGEAMATPQLTAASNWHALATYACRFTENLPAMLLDIGSTTCDLIPLVDGREAAVGRTDTERLAAGELVYTGVERTPVSAVLNRLPWRGQHVPVSAELFATTLDAYLLLGDLSESSDCTKTADGRGQTRQAAHARLARMICADGTLISEEETSQFAEAICTAQVDLLASEFHHAASSLPTAPQVVLVSGQGEFLARRLLPQLGFAGRVKWLCEDLGKDVSRCAPAHALAVLASESFAGEGP